MPRLLALLVALMLVPSVLAGCGGGGSDDAQADSGVIDDGPVEVPAEPASFIAADPGPGSDYLQGMDAHADGSTVVCGWFERDHTWEAGTADETTHVALDRHDGYVARYDPEGNMQWVQLVLGTDFINMGEVAALSDGSAVVMGWTRDLAILAPAQPEQVLIDEGGPAAFVARYLADGTLDWVRVISGHEVDARAATVFADDSVAFVGRVHRDAVWGAGESGETTLAANSTSVLTDYVVRYAKNGDLMYAVAPSDGAGLTLSMGAAALSDDSVVVAGYFADTATFGAGTASVQTFTAGGVDDGYVVRLSATGEQQWVRQLGGTGRELPIGAAALPNGTVAIVGSFTDASVVLSQGTANARTINGSVDGNTFVCRYNAAGDVVWSTHVAHGVGAYLNLAGIAAFADNSIAFIGAGPASVTVDPGGVNEAVLPSFDASDLLLAKYDAAGELAWARRDGGLGTIARAEGIAAYPSGALGFAGGYQREFTVDHGGPGETTYAGVPGGTDTLLIRYNADGSHDGR